MARTTRTLTTEKQAKNSCKTVWQTAIYIRLSREDGNDESLSVTNQRARLLKNFEQLSLEAPMELVNIYIDAKLRDGHILNLHI